MTLKPFLLGQANTENSSRKYREEKSRRCLCCSSLNFSNYAVVVSSKLFHRISESRVLQEIVTQTCIEILAFCTGLDLRTGYVLEVRGVSVGIDDEPAFLHERVAQSDGLAAGIFLGHVPRGLQGNPVNMVAYQNTAFLKAPSRPLTMEWKRLGVKFLFSRLTPRKHFGSSSKLLRLVCGETKAIFALYRSPARRLRVLKSSAIRFIG